jgi:hypothetical protein
MISVFNAAIFGHPTPSPAYGPKLCCPGEVEGIAPTMPFGGRRPASGLRLSFSSPPPEFETGRGGGEGEASVAANKQLGRLA